MDDSSASNEGTQEGNDNVNVEDEIIDQRNTRYVIDCLKDFAKYVEENVDKGRREL
jgi:hypothetical protein